MKRRDFIKGGIATVAAASTAGAVGVLARTSSAQSPGTPQILERFTIRGQQVEVLQRAQAIGLRLNGRELSEHVMFRVGRDGFGSHLFPFTTYRRPRDLAADLIEYDRQLFVL